MNSSEAALISSLAVNFTYASNNQPCLRKLSTFRQERPIALAQKDDKLLMVLMNPNSLRHRSSYGSLLERSAEPGQLKHQFEPYEHFQLLDNVCKSQTGNRNDQDISSFARSMPTSTSLPWTITSPVPLPRQRHELPIGGLL